MLSRNAKINKFVLDCIIDVTLMSIHFQFSGLMMMKYWRRANWPQALAVAIHTVASPSISLQFSELVCPFHWWNQSVPRYNISIAVLISGDEKKTCNTYVSFKLL
jgi:hypothetical protein